MIFGRAITIVITLSLYKLLFPNFKRQY